MARILVVDDVPANVEMLEELLTAAGYANVATATDPAEGLEKFGLFNPDLVLLDFRMPRLDGAAFLREARRRFPDLAPPVLVLTAQTDQATRRVALEAGARDFVSKPLEFWELLARVRNLLELHMLAKAQKAKADTLEVAVRARTHELERVHREVVRRLCAAGEFRDADTGQHVVRIGVMAGVLARAAGCTDACVNLVETAAPLHDIGKIAIPDRILLKPGPLDETEWKVMQGHTVAGHRILAGSGIAMLDAAAEIALCHHEHWNGSGYPRGLAGEAIPLNGRIVAVVDVFDALCSPRPYKRPWPAIEVAAYLRTHAGSQFDPKLVDCFLAGFDRMLKLRDDLDSASGLSL
ncbi:HD-GYP domain-containing protein [Arenibaculum pallidiluteum]|uniref:HD-GYP domain-containing protein n=1 Tax=Arenibaculum pallidiluteum TaxID=2812559 RepID=UPI001A976B76|nr:HD domain-containing phosphohydrolase [Arenibaculum pallidiluteum]